jgi:uncharacterized protein YerC
MSKVVLNEEEKKEFFKKFTDAIEYSYKADLLSDFLIDFFSETELDSFIKRLEVFKRLQQGDSYAKLNQELSVSPITTSKVAKSLRDSSDNYKKILSEISGPSKIEHTSAKETTNKRSSYLG